MPGVAWPSDMWLSRIEFQSVPIGQIVREQFGAPPHNTRDPVWRIVTTIRSFNERTAHRFLNSLNGASQTVELPLSGPRDGLLVEDQAVAADGEWNVTSTRLGSRYTEVVVQGRGGVPNPPVGAIVRLGSPDVSRVYEIDATDGNALFLNPRVQPPTGSTRLFGARTITVRMDTRTNPQWGARDRNVAGTCAGMTVSWYEAT